MSIMDLTEDLSMYTELWQQQQKSQTACNEQWQHHGRRDKMFTFTFFAGTVTGVCIFIVIIKTRMYTMHLHKKFTCDIIVATQTVHQVHNVCAHGVK